MKIPISFEIDIPDPATTTERLVAQRHAAAKHHHLDVFFRPRQTTDFRGHLIGQAC